MKINNETKVGVMVVLVIAGLIGLTIKAGHINLSKGGYEMRIEFQDINGLKINSPVMFNGLEVGSVVDILIKDKGNKTVIELSIRIDDKVKLREGTRAFVKNLGFMGEKYVGLTAGDVGGAVLKKGDLIIGEEPVNFEELVSKGEQIAEEAQKIGANINELLESNKGKIDEILVNVNGASKSIASISGSLDGHLGENKTRINELIANLNRTSKNLEEMSYDLKLNPWKLLYKQKVREMDR